MESKVVVPAEGAKITIDAKGKLNVPNNNYPLYRR